MVKIGNVVVNVGTEEEVDKSNTITDYPIEDGSVVSDNSERKPILLSISGMIKGVGAFKKLQQLRKYSDDAEIITYLGRNSLNDCLIESITTSHGNNVKGGFTFTATLKQVLIAELQETNINFDVVVPQAISGNKSLGKKSMVELPAKEEDILESPLIPYKIPTLTDVREVMHQKIELNNSKGRAAMKEQITKFKSDERRKIKDKSVTHGRTNYVPTRSVRSGAVE